VAASSRVRSVPGTRVDHRRPGCSSPASSGSSPTAHTDENGAVRVNGERPLGGVFETSHTASRRGENTGAAPVSDDSHTEGPSGAPSPVHRTTRVTRALDSA
jgi:hypothetical protein